MMITSEQLFTLCQSDQFLSGKSNSLSESKFSFEGRKSWEIRIVDASEYLDAVRITNFEEDRQTSWHLLHENHLPNVGLIASRTLSLGTGPAISRLKKKKSELSRILCTLPKTTTLAEVIGNRFNVDSDRLMAESLGELAYSHLGVMLGVCELVPSVEFPIFTVLYRAYEAGLMPFGVYGWQLDQSYSGPDVLLCIAPGDI